VFIVLFTNILKHVGVCQTLPAFLLQMFLIMMQICEHFCVAGQSFANIFEVISTFLNSFTIMTKIFTDLHYSKEKM
jgi:hypothetical protein